ncbi:MAG: hypothetical protein Q8L10_05045 [Candidatus Moranbacteria bacterium]|nr:hypothetical protein [Candidatus Moranbacteria bacterium]
MEKNIPTSLGVAIIVIFAITALFMVYKADEILAANGTGIL